MLIFNVARVKAIGRKVVVTNHWKLSDNKNVLKCRLILRRASIVV